MIASSETASAAPIGTPQISLAKTVNPSTLYGTSAEVTLTAGNPSGPDAYNLSFTDELPPGAVLDASDPAPDQVIPLIDASGAATGTLLVWTNTADLLRGTESSITYSFSYDEDVYEVGSELGGEARADVNTSPRTTPKVLATTTVTPAIPATPETPETPAVYTQLITYSDSSGSNTALASTELVPYTVAKSEPSTEGELLRGIKDNKTAYTVTVRNNLIHPTSDIRVVDYLPAGLEFLGCTNVDNSTTVLEEYTGAGRHENGGFPALSGCIEPDSVRTVALAAGAVNGLPAGVYTEVIWENIGTLAPGQSIGFQYAAAVPLRENVLIDGDDADPTGNLDNNLGALTRDEQGLSNVAIAAGTYLGDPYEVQGRHTVSAEDVAIHKTGDSAVIAHGQVTNWTLDIRTSEYASATGSITVTDVIPDGLAFVPGSASPSAASATVNPDGTQSVVWVLDPATDRGDRRTIGYQTTTLTNYRQSDAPVSSRDSWSNEVLLETDATVVTESGTETTTVAVTDASSAQQSARPVTITKEVAARATDPAACDDADVNWSDETGPDSFGAGDEVCFRLTASFPNAVNTVGAQVVDFLPDGLRFLDSVFTEGSDYKSGDATFTTDGPRLTWTLTTADAADTFQVIVRAAVEKPAELVTDVSGNLMKFAYTNIKGDRFQLRERADLTTAFPVIGLDKGIRQVNAGPIHDPAVDSLGIEAGDSVAYRVSVTNSGEAAAQNVRVLDRLPSLLDCSNVTTGGLDCTDGVLTFVIPTLAPGETVALDYRLDFDTTQAPGDEHRNDAGVTRYEVLANTGTPFPYYPADNIDPDLDPQLVNAPAARDSSTVATVAMPTIAKTRTTSVTETGNRALDQATIGETVDYTVTVTIPKGTTLYNNPRITDEMPADLAIVPGSATYRINGLGSSAATVSGQVITVPLATGAYTASSTTSPDVVVLTFSAVVANATANVNERTRDNTASLGWANAAGTSRSVETAAAAARITIVEPNLAIAKIRTADIAGSTDPGDAVTPGSEVFYRVTASNSRATAHDVVVTDQLPAGTVLAQNPQNGVYDAEANTLSWTIPSLVPGQASTPTVPTVFHYSITLPGSIAGNGLVKNTATITGTSLAGNVAGERTASTAQSRPGYSASTTRELYGPTLGLTKTSPTASATIGETVDFQIQVTVPANTRVFDTTVLDTIPLGYTFDQVTSVSCTGGTSCVVPTAAELRIGSSTTVNGSATLGFFLGDFSEDPQERVITIGYTGWANDAATPGTALQNSAVVRFNQSDTITSTPSSVPTAASFTQGTTTPVRASVPVTQPVLSLDKSVAGQSGDSDTRNAKPGDTLDYTVVVSNAAANGSAAYDIVVTDTPDRRLTGFSWSQSGGATAVATDADPSDGTLRWTIAGPLAAGQSVTITYSLTVPADFTQAEELVSGPEVVNTATVTDYEGVPTGSQIPGRPYRDYSTVTGNRTDTVNVELDLASLGDTVWHDVNGDGVPNAGEPGIADATVTLERQVGGTWVAAGSTTTDADGRYLFEHLPGGTYRVTVDQTTIPAGMRASYDLDNGATGANGVWIGTLAEDGARTDVDFGFTGTGSLGNLVWYDRNKDGVQNAGEGGLGGVLITVVWAGPDGDLSTTDDNITYTTRTATDGGWQIRHLPSGPYSTTVEELDDGYVLVSTTDGTASPSPTLIRTLHGVNAVSEVRFGFAGPGSLGSQLWYERSGDTVYDGAEGDAPLAGATLTVTWFGPDGAEGGGDDSVFTATTDADGRYLLDGLLTGIYSVEVTGGVAANATVIHDRDATADGITEVEITLAAPAVLDADFGYEPSGSLGQRVWWDRDGDGVFDAATEHGLPGVGISILAAGPDGVLGTADDRIAATTTTDADGLWQVDKLPDGPYRVTVTGGIPAGLVLSHDRDGTLDGQVELILAAGDLTIDFGYRGALGIGDQLWLDRDADGVQDADEPGISGATVQLLWAGPDGDLATASDNRAFSTSSDATGGYAFDGLPAGEYRVTVTEWPSGLRGVTPGYDRDGGSDASTRVSLTASTDTVDFAVVGSGSIGQVVWLDRDADGVRELGDPGLAGIGVIVRWHGQDGIANTSDDALFTTVTDADGGYEVSGLPYGGYTVSLDAATIPAGLTSTFDSDGDTDLLVPLTLSSAAPIGEADWGLGGGISIGDRVWLDLNGDGIQDADEPGLPDQIVRVTWADAATGNTVVSTAVTAADGAWTIGNLPDGDFSIEIVGGVTAFAEPTLTHSSFTLNGTSRADLDFGFTGPGELGDTVFWDLTGDGVNDAADGDQPLEGVEIAVRWFGADRIEGTSDDVLVAVLTTDATGEYGIAGLPLGNYSVAVGRGVPAGLMVSSDAHGPSDGVSLVTLDSTAPIRLDQDFGYTGRGSIGSLVWFDSDGDGTLGGPASGEAGIPGIGVTLVWAGADGLDGTADDRRFTTLTDAEGHYLFEHLPAGRFTITLDGVPNGLVSTTAATTGRGSDSSLTLAASQSNLSQNFGFRGDSAVGDLVWYDVDGDGLPGPLEPGVAGLTVTLRMPGLDGALGTPDDIVVQTVTDAEGRYLFENLQPGTGVVSYDPADLRAGSVPGADFDGGADASTEVSMSLGVLTDTADFGVLGTGALTGVVFDDRDADRQRGPGEGGVPDVTLVVSWDGPKGPITWTVVTGPDGSWSLGQLPPGDYTVVIDESTVPQGYRATTATTVSATILAGETATVVNGVSNKVLASTGPTVLVVWTALAGILLALLGVGLLRRRRRESDPA